MWCDNCLLILPLRYGAMAWGIFLALYSCAGGILLFKWGPFLFFTYPEWDIYGGISMGIGAVAAINVIALSNQSYVWIRACKFMWPLIVLISSIRATIIILELYRGKDKIIWECENGGQLWGASANAGYAGTTSFPDTICAPGFSGLWTAWIFALLIDLVVQLYMWFLNWRFSKRLEHYSSLKGAMGSSYYTA